MKAVLILLLLLLVLLAGCNKCIKPADLAAQGGSLKHQALEECSKRAINYLVHYLDGYNWQVICYQENPLKFFEYKLDVKK